MRVTIKFDSAETDRVREIAVALHGVGLAGQLRVGLNGPERWTGETPPMQPWQFAQVAARLVTFEGALIADALNTLRLQS